MSKQTQLAPLTSNNLTKLLYKKEPHTYYLFANSVAYRITCTHTISNPKELRIIADKEWAQIKKKTEEEIQDIIQSNFSNKPTYQPTIHPTIFKPNTTPFQFAPPPISPSTNNTNKPHYTLKFQSRKRVAPKFDALVEKLQGAEKEHGLLTNEVQRMDGVRGLEDKLKEKHV